MATSLPQTTGKSSRGSLLTTATLLIWFAAWGISVVGIPVVLASRNVEVLARCRGFCLHRLRYRL